MASRTALRLSKGCIRMPLGSRLRSTMPVVSEVASTPVVSALATRNPNMTPVSPQLARDWLAPIVWKRGYDDARLEGPRESWWWTGKAPDQCPGWDAATRSLHSMPLLNTGAPRDAWLDYFDNTWTLTELLFSSLESEATFMMQSYHHLRQPLIFYYGHVPALYINKLRVAGLLRNPVNPYYEALFETGVDEMSWDDLSQSSTLWPTVAEVHQYRQQVYETVRHVIETHPLLGDGHDPVLCDSPLWAVAMAFEHERIHLETSSVLMRELPQPLVRRPAGWVADHPSVPTVDTFEPRAGRDYPIGAMVNVDAATIPLGKSREWPSFGWDNEYGAASRPVPAFSASEFKVSNGEFFDFVRDGGYRESGYWTDDGWRWRTFRNAKWPTFWTSVGPANLHQYRLRTLYDVVPMPWAWPAEVNYHEAKAFTCWKASKTGLVLRLTTEGEHLRIREAASVGKRPMGLATEGDPVMAVEGVTSSGLNMNLVHGTPAPVDAGKHAGTGGFGDAMGNVWEWCEDDFHPLDGFKVHDLYDDFSTPCFDGEHNVIMGGSWVSTGDEASVYARFHFRPHFFQHAGFRLVAPADVETHPLDAAGVKLRAGGKHGADSAGYEGEELLNQYLNFHYGEPADVLPFADGPHEALNFPQRCAALVDKYANALNIPKGRVLDIGCAVGGSAFELGRTYESVVGVDLSASFINAAQRLQSEGSLPYFRRDEGDLGERMIASMDMSSLNGSIVFKRADACALPPDMMNFDACLLANLLCRLPSPRACLGRLGGPRGLIKPGGLTVIVSPYSWLEEHTNHSAWLGGFYKDDGTPVRTCETLCKLLGDEFHLVGEEDVPMIIREHARKYQYVVSHALIFQRHPAVDGPAE